MDEKVKGSRTENTKSPGQKLKQKSTATMAQGKKLRHGRADTADTAAEIKKNRKAVLKGRKQSKQLVGYKRDVAIRREARNTVMKNEDQNVGTESLQEGMAVADYEASAIESKLYSRKLKSEHKAEHKHSNEQNPKDGSNPKSRAHQKKQVRKTYYAKEKEAEATKTFATKAEEVLDKISTAVSNAIEKIGQYIAENPKVLLIILIAAVVVVLLSAFMTSCSVAVSAAGNGTSAATYTAYDEDILAVDKLYRDKETELKEKIDNVPADYPGYDEYEYFLDEIGHNPYELAAYLTVKYEDYKKIYVKNDVQDLFDSQYKLTLTPRTETRTRTVTKTVPTEDGGTEEIEVEEEYEVKILKVTLENKSLGTVIEGKGLTSDEKNRYDILLSTKGNKEYLFESIYDDVDPEQYHVPGEALSDQQFARMIGVAEQYLGMEYVWGGSSPSTGFDCSGFVSWVLNHSGWNVGRRGAASLRNMCTIVPESEAKPGDLIFFQGTYDVVGTSHVGIYVGDGMMIHCGNPIQYTSIETRYWKNHFYGYGRLPEP